MNACERSEFWIRQLFVRVRKRLQTSSQTVFIVANSLSFIYFSENSCKRLQNSRKRLQNSRKRLQNSRKRLQTVVRRVAKVLFDLPMPSTTWPLFLYEIDPLRPFVAKVLLDSPSL